MNKYKKHSWHLCKWYIQWKHVCLPPNLWDTKLSKPFKLSSVFLYILPFLSPEVKQVHTFCTYTAYLKMGLTCFDVSLGMHCFVSHILLWGSYNLIYLFCYICHLLPFKNIVHLKSNHVRMTIWDYFIHTVVWNFII